MKNNLKSLIEFVIDQAVKDGATGVQASVSYGKGFTVSARQLEVETIEYHQDQELDLVVYYNQKKGHVSISDLSMESVKNTLKAVRDIAKYTEEDPFLSMPDKDKLAFDAKEPNLDFPWEIDVREASRIAIACERGGFEFDPRISNSNGSSVTRYEGYGVFANNLGFYGESSGSSHCISCSFLTEEDGRAYTDYDYSAKRDAQDFEDPVTIGQNAAKNTLGHLGARPIKTGSYPVLFAARQAKSLIGCFLSAISGGSLYRKSSFLVDTLGESIFPHFISIKEYPLLPKGFGTSAYDGEGVKSQEKYLVENGILSSYLLSTYSAKKLGMETTGNSGGAFNPTVEGPTESFDALVKKMGTGLIVTELMGSGVKLVTGDYSQGAGGFWVENGEIQHAVSEVTIASNLRDMFQKIVGLGNDINHNGNVLCGSLLLENMMVAAGQ